MRDIQDYVPISKAKNELLEIIVENIVGIRDWKTGH